jgi:hypothetical protein
VPEDESRLKMVYKMIGRDREKYRRCDRQFKVLLRIAERYNIDLAVLKNSFIDICEALEDVDWSEHPKPSR